MVILMTQGATLPTIPRLSIRTPILTYHDVIPTRSARSLWFDCSVAELREQLTWLKVRGAKFVSIDQIRDHLTGKKLLAQGSVAVTFADNYEGFYKRGWPIIKQMGIPVAMFVHTGFVGNQQGRPKMTWAQLKELQQSGLVTVCSQTVSHPTDLRKMTDSEMWRELVESKRAIETEIGRPCQYLAYPNGVFDDRCAKMAAAAGYRLAFTEKLSPAEGSPNLLMINRYVHTKYRQAWKDSNPKSPR